MILAVMLWMAATVSGAPSEQRKCGEVCLFVAAIDKTELPDDLAPSPDEAGTNNMALAMADYISCHTRNISKGFVAADGDQAYDSLLEAAYSRCSPFRDRLNPMIGDYIRHKYPNKSRAEVSDLTDAFRGAMLVDGISKAFATAGFKPRFDQYLTRVVETNAQNHWKRFSK